MGILQHQLGSNLSKLCLSGTCLICSFSRASQGGVNGYAIFDVFHKFSGFES
jgi:hypothetical protein